MISKVLYEDPTLPSSFLTKMQDAAAQESTPNYMSNLNLIPSNGRQSDTDMHSELVFNNNSIMSDESQVPGHETIPPLYPTAASAAVSISNTSSLDLDSTVNQYASPLKTERGSESSKKQRSSDLRPPDNDEHSEEWKKVYTDIEANEYKGGARGAVDMDMCPCLCKYDPG
jgi:hypothetical protein